MPPTMELVYPVVTLQVADVSPAVKLLFVFLEEPYFPPHSILRWDTPSLSKYTSLSRSQQTGMISI